jgi:hypothetical protein
LFDFKHEGNYLMPLDTPYSFKAYFVQQRIILTNMKVFKSPHIAMGLIDRCFAGLCLHKYCTAVMIVHKITAWSASYIEIMAWADDMVSEYEREEEEAELKKQQQCQQLALRKPAGNAKKDNERAKKAALARICSGEDLLPQGTWLRFKPYSKTAAALPGFQRNPFCFGLMCIVDEVWAGDGARASVLYRVQFHGILQEERSGDADMTTKRHSIITSWSDDIHLCIKAFWKPDEANHLSKKSKYDQDLSKSKEHNEAGLQRMLVMDDATMARRLKTGDSIQFVSYDSEKHDHLPPHLKCLLAKKAVIRGIMCKGDAYACRLQIDDDDHSEVVLLSLAMEEVLAILL